MPDLNNGELTDEEIWEFDSTQEWDATKAACKVASAKMAAFKDSQHEALVTAARAIDDGVQGQRWDDLRAALPEAP